MVSKRTCVVVVLVMSLFRIAAQASGRPINADKSVMSVHVYKSGLFSAFGHEHDISAPIRDGEMDEQTPSATLHVDAKGMKVTDHDVSDEDRAKVQNTMLGPQVLDVEKFPEIAFKSTQIDRLGDGKWLVHGDLTLHGQTRPVVVHVEGQSGHYQGSAELKQKDFGITPVNAGGGTVKVKNEVRVHFEIWSK
jgi:polyisoprenoid-binding protein YceI